MTMRREATPDLTTRIGALELKNPIMSASGTFGYGTEFVDYLDLNDMGAIVVKGLSLKPTHGNPPPRVVETAAGMLNAIGLENPGLEVFLRDKLPPLVAVDAPVIVNIYGPDIGSYVELARRLDSVAAVDAIELNISCPNVKAGGVAFGVDPESAYAVVSETRAVTDKHLMVKLSPNVTDIVRMAKTAEAAGADSLSLINTITGMAIDLAARRPVLANITGGLSGPAIKPVALRMVWQVAGAVDIPVVGIGGIATAEDALEFLLAGACAVQVGTASFVNPRACVDVAQGISDYLQAHGIERITDLVGALIA